MLSGTPNGDINDEAGGFSIGKGANDVSKNIIIRNNVITDSNTGMLALDEFHIYNNTILNNRRNAANGPNQAHLQQGAKRPNRVGVIYSVSGLSQAQAPDPNISILNNIIGDHGYEVIMEPIDGGTIDGNVYFNSFQAPQFSVYTGNFNWTTESFASWQAWLQSSASNFTGFDANSQVVSGAAELFENVPAQVTGDPAQYDFSLKASSPAVDAGIFLTSTIGSGSGTTMNVADAGVFMDGFGITAGDEIQLEGQTQRAKIVSISGNTLTFDQSLNWSAGLGVSLSYEGAGPDVGAIELTSIPGSPVANNDFATTDEDTSVTTVDVLLNDTDPDPGDTPFIVSFTQPINGSVVDSSNGTFTYTPNPDFNGNDSFTYTIFDGNSGTDTATVSIAVNPINDLPTAIDDSAITDQGIPVTTVNVLLNDIDPDVSDTLTVLSFTQPSSGSVVDNGNGTFTYTPNASFLGSDSFTYTVTDGNGGTDTATVSLSVLPQNNVPTAFDDSATTNEDISVTTVNVLLNDTDPDTGDILAVESFTQASSGSVVNNGDGTFTYTPNANFNGNDSFTYTMNDGRGGTDSATVSLTVNPVNDAPTANDDTASTDKDTPVTTANVLLNDTDIDTGDTLSVQSFTQASNGLVVNNGNGTFTYTPNAGFIGNDSFAYTVTDGNGGTDTATVSLTVIREPGVLLRYDFSNGSGLTVVDQSGNGNAGTLTGFASTAAGAGVFGTSEGWVSGGGINFLDDSVRSFVETTLPTSALAGRDVTIEFTANFDGAGGTVPAISNSSNGSIAEAFGFGVNNGSRLFAILPDGRTDVFSGANPWTSSADPTEHHVVMTFDVSTGLLEIYADDILVGSKSKSGVDFNNSSANFHIGGSGWNISEQWGGVITGVAISDEKLTPGSFVLSVGAGGNNAPTANNDSATTNEDSPVTTINVLLNDTDPDAGDTLSVQSFTQPSNGSVVNNGNGTFTYTPNANFNGSDSFTYTVSDGNGGTDSATVSLIVAAVNDAPTANADSATTNEDTSVTTINVLLNDTDPDVGDTLSVQSFTQPSNGVVVNNGNGTFTYTPSANFNGNDAFTYTVSDGNGGTDTATVSLTVIPGSNGVPMANDDLAVTNVDTPVTTINVLLNDTDPDPGDTLTVQSFTQANNGSVVNNGNGTFTYTPNAGFTGSDLFTYTVTDGNGGTDTATVNLTVNAAASNGLTGEYFDQINLTQPAGTRTDSVINFPSDALGDDAQGQVQSDDNYSIRWTGFVKVDQAGQWQFTTFSNDGVRLWVDDVQLIDHWNQHGSARDDGQIQLSAGWHPIRMEYFQQGGSTDARLLFSGPGQSEVIIPQTSLSTVEPGGNSAPTAVNDSAITNEDIPVTTVNVLLNDTDPDAGDTLSVQSSTQPSQGTVVNNGNGTFTYTPDANFFGQDSFTYTVSDGNGGTDTATVSLAIVSVNDDPIANNDSVTTNENTTVTTVNVLLNDTDPDLGQTLQVSGFSQPASGSVVYNGDGTFTYTPNSGFTGSDFFKYSLSDGNGGFDEADVFITVNAAPISGLTGEYFDSINLTQSVGTRTDAVVNFPSDALGNDAQGQVQADDNYSIRWTGFVKVDQTGQWQFTTFSNDGVRLWVDGTQLIDHWNQHGSARDDGQIQLTAGWHPIQMEYFQQGGTTDARLLFSGPGQSEVIIPQTSLAVIDPSSSSIQVSGAPGDFDTDGDVDGSDFLQWQLGSTSGDLANWQASFGASSAVAAAVSTVPSVTVDGPLDSAFTEEEEDDEIFLLSPLEYATASSQDETDAVFGESFAPYNFDLAANWHSSPANALEQSEISSSKTGEQPEEEEENESFADSFDLALELF